MEQKEQRPCPVVLSVGPVTGLISADRRQRFERENVQRPVWETKRRVKIQDLCIYGVDSGPRNSLIPRARLAVLNGVTAVPSLPFQPIDKILGVTAEEVRAGEIVLAAVAPFVVGVFTKRSPQQQDWMFATGTAVEFAGTKLVLTAAHVLSEHPGDQPTEMVFLPMPQGGFKISKSLDCGSYPRSQRLETSRVVGDRQVDLGAILFERPPDISFFPIPDEVTPLLAPGRPVAICGYPKAKSKTAQIGSVVTDLALADFQGAIVMDRSIIPGLQPFQFPIDYPKMAGVALPGGYSGALVWYDTANCRTVEQLQGSLIVGAGGVVTDHDPAHDALLCSDANAIVRFLRQISQ